MSVFKSKSIEIIILTGYSLLKQQPLPYISALILPFVPIHKPLITISITCLSLIPNVIKLDPTAIALLVIAILTHIFNHGIAWNSFQQTKPRCPLSSKYLIFIYLFSFSLLSISNIKLTHYVALILLYIMLIIYLTIAESNMYLRYAVVPICYATLLWGIISYVTLTSELSYFNPIRYCVQQQWWYYFVLSLANWIGAMLAYQIKLQLDGLCQIQSINQNHSVDEQISKQKGNGSYEMIQMRPMSVYSAEQIKQDDHQSSDSKGDHQSMDASSNSSRRNRLPAVPYQLVTQGDNSLIQKLLDSSEDLNLQKHRQMLLSSWTDNVPKKNRKKNEQLKQQEMIPCQRPKTTNIRPDSRSRSNYNFQNSKQMSGCSSGAFVEQQKQQQLTNLFLIIPFTLFRPSFLHIPIYAYLIFLQNGKVPAWLFYCMYLSICAITLIEQQASFRLQVLLRLCLILIVNKNFKLAINITRVLRSIWLRSSFVFVLLILFWFSLLTVNLFHISFVLIVLIFITRTNNPHSKQPSFRHRNWKYLVFLFNVFLVLRLTWLITQTDFTLNVPFELHDILSIIGITYNYGLSISYFNMIPLLVSGVLTLQYWTYSSRIYDLQSKRTLQFLPSYRAFILRVLQILTIIYYKLIPWASHLFVIVIIITLQFSIIADLVLVWSLFILFVHMVRPNEFKAYKTMYRMWDIFLKLVSVQIILRYIFEFIKFPLIFGHISQFPIIKTLIKYQQFLGLAIRQSSNSYIKNIFTKFQLMMILDFAIIAISFVTIEYYQIMIKYYQITQNKPNNMVSSQEPKPSQNNIQHVAQQKIKSSIQQKNNSKISDVQIVQQIIRQNSEKVSNQDAILIYEKYIDFKLTIWLQSFNQLMLIFSKIYLKIYYPFLGTYSSIYYSYATLVYFLCCVYYYLKINLKYYQVYVISRLQPRIMKLFHLWRLQNQIRINLVQKTPITTNQILYNKNNNADLEQKSQSQVLAAIQKQKLYLNQNQTSKNIMPTYEQIHEQIFNQLQSQMSNQVPTTKNPYTLYKSLRKQLTETNAKILFDHLINLHAKMRLVILTLTMICIVLNFTSRTFFSDEIKDFFSQQAIQQIKAFLFIFGASIQSPIHINIYLLIIALTVVQIKCCSLVNRIGQPKQTQDLQGLQDERPNQNKQISIYDTIQIKKFIDVSISLRLGINKIAQRFFVILLVFVSLLQNQNPFSIVYLICAWFLNYMGPKSIQGLSLTLSFLLAFQYSLIISDTTNKYVGVINLFPEHVHQSWVVQLFGIQDKEWISYLAFGKKLNQRFILYLSLSILMLYQVCFYLQEYNWLQILDKMFEKITIGGIYLKIYQKISQVYEYALVYSPLFIIILCLGLYLMDFTATNMFLSILSLIFIYKSFLLQDYTDSRPFWKSYFRILQLLIVIFMTIYCILSAPMYNEYCNKFLCSPEQFRTKITKTILLLILQIGIDLISSHHFINAMATLENTLNQTSSYYRIAISIVQNDRKIEKQFQSVKKKENIKKSLSNIRNFLNQYENDQTVRYDNCKQEQAPSQPWLQTILNYLPSFIDPSLTRSPNETKQFVRQQNKQFIKWLEQKKGHKLSEEQLKNINQLYVNQFVDCKDTGELKQKMINIINREKKNFDQNLTDSMTSIKPLRRQVKNIIQSNQLHNYRRRQHVDRILQQTNQEHEDSDNNSVRKSYIQGILPFQSQIQIVSNTSKLQSLKSIKETRERKSNKLSQVKSQRNSMVVNINSANKQQKKKLLYLKIFQSIVSNWHYLTYLLMILQFVINMGVLTLPFPILTFSLGIIHAYQAPKTLWRLAFLALLPPIFFKYTLQIQLIKPGQVLKFVLIGSNNTSILIEYLLMFFIIIQCLILKIAGLYDQSTAQVECMNIALIRNILNVDENNKTKDQEREAFFALLQRSKRTSETFFQYLFSIYECKTGYDFSTMMVTIQLVTLFYIFTFYDSMAVRQQLTFYKMIQYNQFTTGMVVMVFIQLGFMLFDRILTILEFTYKKWDVTLIIKYVVLIISLIYVHAMVLAFFPINANYFAKNNYIIVFYFLHIFYFLISSLQIKVGMNKESRGFMDRYTWYNGYIYMTYRAIPFLFEFKIFSDWTFTTTSLRLFDWIKYEQILGYLYVAKCNSLFLKGKILGSKIQWWKKLLMGFPLLLTIVLLLFGPLILFSSLNPLASLNQITGGYLQLSLKINKTNQYPFYINTHITDIHFLDKEPDKQLQQIIKTYELDERSIQIVHLQPFSDQYWEISQGSYNKLIEQPEGSLYQLTMRVKFERNETKTTPVYVLNTYTIPQQRVYQFKETLQGKRSFKVKNFVPAFMRLDNNNGLHFLVQENYNLQFRAEQSRTLKKKYWVINDGITFKMASDKYSKAIFGYSVMSFYISIILVVANYFRFLFQGSSSTIIMSDLPYADPVLSICDGIHQARLRKDIYEQEMLFWTLIDIIRSPDLMKAITGNYLNARMQTLKLLKQKQSQSQDSQENKELKKKS